MGAMRARDCSAVLFDLDGVLTDTASVHERAWGRLFTDVFDAAASRGEVVAPYATSDYFTYIDGKPRNEGVRAVLASRRIDLPDGAADDDPDAHTVNGLGNRKNAMFLAELEQNGATAYAGAVEVLDWLAGQSIPRAVVSSSRNAEPVLRAAGLRDRIDLVVDGLTAIELGIAGKPAPDTYLHAARRLDVAPPSAVVVEDAASGVDAGRRGAFWVVGVDRGAGRTNLLRQGADVVIDELDELFKADRFSASARRPL